MNRRKTLAAVLAPAMLILVFVATGAVAHAQRHPAYLRALSDLRLARGFLDRLTPNERLDEAQANAIKEIDAAIRDIKTASIDDGKDIHDHPPVDARIEPRNRFQKAREALAAARRDVSEGEDNPEVRELKHRSLDHIRSADDLVVSAMQHMRLM